MSKDSVVKYFESLGATNIEIEHDEYGTNIYCDMLLKSNYVKVRCAINKRNSKDKVTSLHVKAIYNRLFAEIYNYNGPKHIFIIGEDFYDDCYTFMQIVNQKNDKLTTLVLINNEMLISGFYNKQMSVEKATQKDIQLHYPRKSKISKIIELIVYFIPTTILFFILFLILYIPAFFIISMFYDIDIVRSIIVTDSISSIILAIIYTKNMHLF